ncbi:MAG TPA: ABC transporter substrate-binding protein [Chloroflexota bacterium]|nr:ABC transporter substrate-binding protein [Chloroflexota bacterium]
MKRMHPLVQLVGGVSAVSALLIGAAPRSVTHAQTARATVEFHLSGQWSPQGQLNPYGNNNIAGFGGLTDNPLAYYIRGTTSYRPALAVSWTMSPQSIVVHLRPGALWQDNQPITSKDVVTTFLGGATVGWSIWNEISAVTARGPETAVFTLRPHVELSDALYNVLTVQGGQNIYPDHVWGQYLPKNVAALAAANNSAALGKAGQALIQAGPATYVGSGPFQISSVGQSQIVLTKFAKFWGANKIKIDRLVVDQALDNTAELNQMLSGWTDFGWATEPLTVQHQWLSNPNNHIALPFDYSMYAAYFQTRHYPLNITAFRQALAYIINRKNDTQIADPVNIPDQVPTLLLPPVAQQWLPKSVYSSLNPYNPDAAKATALLTGAGFKKSGGQWLAPNGKPIKLTLMAPAGYTSSVVLMESMANEMKQFGFTQVTSTSVDQSVYWTDQNEGNFDISWGFAGYWTLDPIQEFYDLLVNENLTPKNPQYIGMGFGPNVTLEGFGTVNLTSFMQKLRATNDTAQISKAVVALAKLENTQLPLLPIEVKRLQTWYSSRTFTNWPAANNPLWTDCGGWATSALSLMMQEGYVTPK